MNHLSKAKFISYLVAIFLAGGVTGATVAVSVTRQMVAEPPHSGRMDARYLKERFRSKLDLSPEQAEIVEPILEKTSEELKSIRAETSKRIGLVMKNSYELIGKELTSEQRIKLEEMKKDRLENNHRKFKSSPDSVRKSNSPPQMPEVEK